MAHDRHECDAVEQVVHLRWGDVPDDVAPAPVLALLEGDVEAVLRRVCVCVAHDLVGVAAPGRGADDDGPVKGEGLAGSKLAAPVLGDFDGIAALGDQHWVEDCREGVLQGAGYGG